MRVGNLLPSSIKKKKFGFGSKKKALKDESSKFTECDFIIDKVVLTNVTNNLTLTNSNPTNSLISAILLYTFCRASYET
jgi:hypothetical protein